MRIPAIASLAACIAAASCGGSDKSPTGVQPSHKVYDVVTSGETFLPTIQAIAVGDSVRFTFSVAADGFGHNVLFNQAPGAPPDIPGNVKSGSVTRAFNTKGNFNYVCALHGGMTGQIIVQ